ncbi:MAG: hypothetical protein Q8Q36_02980 [bacterium]|nr:hypothetical protein [bacterium]
MSPLLKFSLWYIGKHRNKKKRRFPAASFVWYYSVSKRSLAAA